MGASNGTKRHVGGGQPSRSRSFRSTPLGWRAHTTGVEETFFNAPTKDWTLYTTYSAPSRATTISVYTPRWGEHIPSLRPYFSHGQDSPLTGGSRIWNSRLELSSPQTLPLPTS